jgi:DNA-binding IclR family transcriptional regulator
VSKIVDRTLDFFEMFAEQRRPLGLSEIARILDIPVSSCHDVMQALIRRGYVYEIAARAGFYPTIRLLRLGETLVEHDPILLRAEMVVEELTSQLRETVALAQASKLELTYVLVRESDHQLRFSVKEGATVRSLYATSAGKCLLGALPPAELDHVLEGLKLEPLTTKTITDKKVLRRDIQLGNERGWFLNDEESSLDAQTLSARFVWRGSIYVLTVAGPISRIASKRKQAVKLLLEACGKLDFSAPGLA